MLCIRQSSWTSLLAILHLAKAVLDLLGAAAGGLEKKSLIIRYLEVDVLSSGWLPTAQREVAMHQSFGFISGVS